jgi:carbonic anhydrase
MKPLIIALLVFASAGRALAQIPVTDAANLISNQIAHVETIAKWVESIAQLKAQINQLDRQISLQTDLRQWTGNPVEAGARVVLNGLGQQDLVRQYGQTKDAVLHAVNSLQSLDNTMQENYRAIPSIDLDGQQFQRDPLTYRRYAALDAQQSNADQVASDTAAREAELQANVATTLDQLKSAPTQAEAEKLSAKLATLNGQLAQVETERHRAVDEVVLQKMANDSRLEEERMAAAELEARDDYLANQRVSAYMKTLKLRQNYNDNP